MIPASIQREADEWSRRLCRCPECGERYEPGPASDERDACGECRSVLGSWGPGEADTSRGPTPPR